MSSPQPSDESAISRLKVPVVSGLSMIYSQATSATFGVFLAAYLGAEDYGTMNLARSIFMLAIVLSPCGLELALQRHLGRSRMDPASVAAEVFWPRLFTVVVSVAIVAWLVVGGASFLEVDVFQHAGFGIVLAVTMAGLPFATDLGVLAGAYRGIYRPIPSLLAIYVVQPTARIVAIVALMPLLGGLGATVYGTLASYAVAWLFGAAAFQRDAPLRPHLLRAALPVAKTIFSYAPVLGLGYFLFTLSRSLDTIALGYFATTSDVGRYAIVLMIGQLVAMIGASLGQTLGTSVAAAAETGDNDRIGALLSEVIGAASILCAPFCVAIAVWGCDIDLLLGPSYRIPLDVFAVTALTQWVVTSFNYGSWALQTTGRHMLELWNNVLALVVEAIACVVLVPSLGLFGAALASFLALAAITLARQIQVARFLGKSLFTPRLLAPLLISLVVALPLVVLGRSIGFRAWWLTGALASTHVVVSFAIIALLSKDVAFHVKTMVGRNSRLWRRTA